MSKLGSLHRLANADQGQTRPPVAGTTAQAAADGSGQGEGSVAGQDEEAGELTVLRELLESENSEQTTALLKGIKAGSLSAKAFAFAAQVRRSCCPCSGYCRGCTFRS